MVNAVVSNALLESLVERGVSPGTMELFAIDGSKALRAAIDAVFRGGNPVQRCRNHKIRMWLVTSRSTWESTRPSA